MKKKTSQTKRKKPKAKATIKGRRSARKAIRRFPKRPKMARRRPQTSEVRSDRSLRSSLTEEVRIAPAEDLAGLTAGQSGDLQGLSNIEDADAESVDELLEEGQAYEAEVVQGVEDAPEEKELPRRGRRQVQGEPPVD